MDRDLARRASAEAVGTGFLVAIVVGSGIAAQRLSPGDTGLQLLENSIATGAGLVAYMNFKPGFSLGYDLFPRTGDHEVRERDYFFIVSFVVWGLWAGVGMVDVLRRVLVRRTEKAEPSVLSALSVLSVLSLGLASAPIAANWRDASRST